MLYPALKKKRKKYGKIKYVVYAYFKYFALQWLIFYVKIYFRNKNYF